MRIGIDGGCLANRRGFGRFARQMLTALSAAPSQHELIVFIDRPAYPTVALPKRCEVKVVEVSEAPSRAASATGRRSLRDMLRMGREVARSGIDLMYFPATYSFFPVWNVKRVVVTMHDTLALAHPELVFPTWQGRVSWALKEHAAALWADRVMTVSEAARKDLRAWFHLSDEKLRVVGEGPDPVFQPMPRGLASESALARHGIDAGERYLLYVGGLSPHKNLLRLIEAFARGVPETVRLVMVGDTADVFHTHVPELRAAITRCGLAGRVQLPGFVPDEDLVYLYNEAYALVQPSLKEGFGLPPVEAMACGVPVLSSTAGSLPEVVGEAGLYFDPTNVSAMAEAISTLFEDPGRRAHLAELALERAAQFSWSRSAQTLLEVFDEIDPTWHPKPTFRQKRRRPRVAETAVEESRKKEQSSLS